MSRPEGEGGAIPVPKVLSLSCEDGHEEAYADEPQHTRLQR